MDIKTDDKGRPVCSRCGYHMAKAGTALSGTRRVKAYKCSGCGYAWRDTQGTYGYPEPKRNPCKIKSERGSK